MGRAKFVKHRIAVVFALSFWPLPGVAQNSDALAICKVIQDRGVELARAGESEKLRAMKPQLEKCLKVQREELDRAAREIVRRHNEGLAEPSLAQDAEARALCKVYRDHAMKLAREKGEMSNVKDWEKHIDACRQLDREDWLRRGSIQ